MHRYEWDGHSHTSAAARRLGGSGGSVGASPRFACAPTQHCAPRWCTACAAGNFQAETGQQQCRGARARRPQIPNPAVPRVWAPNAGGRKSHWRLRQGDKSPRSSHPCRPNSAACQPQKYQALAGQTSCTGSCLGARQRARPARADPPPHTHLPASAVTGTPGAGVAPLHRLCRRAAPRQQRRGRMRARRDKLPMPTRHSGQ